MRFGPLPPSFINTYSLDFDGVDDYVSLGTISALNGGVSAFSTSVWFKYTGTPSTLKYMLLSGGTGVTDRFYIQLIATDTIRYAMGGGFDDVNVGTLISGTWYNLITVQNGLDVDIYLNGVLKGSFTDQIPTSNFATNVKIANYISGNYWWNGLIDEVSLYDRVLTPTEITSITSSPTDLTSLSPVAWYRMGDNGAYKSPQWLIPNNENKGKVSNYSFEFDGMDDYVDCGDSDDFSFGNGTTDSPFSISAWINMDDTTKFRIANKLETANREYIFTTDSSDRLSFALYDNSNDSSIQRKYNTALTSLQGQWINVIGTYDGSSSSSGIKIYLNDTRVDDIDNNTGAYVAMENTIQPFEIGRSNLTSFSNGKIDELAVFNVELSTSDITSIFNNGTPTTLPSGAVAHYKMGEEATFVYNVNPDGTWTIPDQVGSNDGTSNNQMADSARVGTAPSSSNNAVSFNMDLVDRVANTPPNP